MAASQTLSRRERHRLATRTALHDAALSLTERLGLSAVTIEAITDAADVAVRTFANYFPSKEDAVLGHDPDDGPQAVAAFADRPAGEDSWTALRAVLRAHTAECVGPHPAVLRKAALMAREPRLRACSAAHFDRVAQDLVAAVRTRQGTDAADDFDTPVMVYAALNACRAAVGWWTTAEPQPPLDEVLARALDRLGKGYSAPQQLRAARRTA